MPVTQAHIDALNQALADGVRQVTLPGGQVTIYQTTESLIKARDDLRNELLRQEAQAAGRRVPRQRILQYNGRDGYHRP